MLKFSYYLIVLIVGSISGCNLTQSDQPLANVAPPAKPFTPNVNSETDFLKIANYNVQLGMGYLHEGNIQRAKLKLMLALKQAPKSAQVYGAMGFFLETTGNQATAEKYYLKGVELSPNEGAGHNNYGAYLCRTDRFEQAEKHFLLAIQDPAYLNTAAVYENAGLCAFKNKEMTKASTYFKKALITDPKLVKSWLGLTELSVQRQDYKNAQHYLTRANQLVEQPSAKALWLGLQIAAQLNNQELVTHYTLLLQNNYPQSEEYQQLLKSPSLNTNFAHSKKTLYY